MIDWSDAQLDDLAALSLADIEPALVWWRTHARRQDRDLLDAGSDDDVRCLRALDGVIAAVEGEMDALMTRLTSGDLTIADWQQAMVEMLRMQTLCAIAAGRGGWARVTVEDITSA